MNELILPASVLISGASGVLALWLSRGKMRAEKESVVVVSAERLVRLAMARIESMQLELEDLKTQIARAVTMEQSLRRDLSRVKVRVVVLERYITAAGLPVPTEDEEKS